MNRRQALRTTAAAAFGMFDATPGGEAMHGETANPLGLLFEAAKRVDGTSTRPEILEDSNRALDGVGKDLSSKEPTKSTFSIGNGLQLDAHKSALATNKTDGIIKCSCHKTWEYNFREVERILHTFFAGARERPCMLWSHTNCWTDRAVQRLVNQIDIELDEPTVGFREYRHGEAASLSFEAGSSRRVTVRTDALLWRRPRGTGDKGTLLKRMAAQSHVSLRTKETRASSYREMIGSSSSDWLGCEFVALGQLPGLAGILHGVAVDQSGEAKLITRESSAGMRGVDSSGIIDVFLLKALRLFRVNLTRTRKRVRNDEVTFAFDREGRIAYIAASCQTFPGYSPETQRGGYLLGWAERYGPSARTSRLEIPRQDVAR